MWVPGQQPTTAHLADGATEVCLRRCPVRKYPGHLPLKGWGHGSSESAHNQDFLWPPGL